MSVRAALATYSGMEEEALRAETQAWWREEVRPFVARGARPVLERHRLSGDRLVLLTSNSR